MKSTFLIKKMKKNTLVGILAAISLTISSCANDKSDNYQSDNNLKGKVKSIKTLTYHANYKFGEIKKGNRGSKAPDGNDDYLIFNGKGKEVECREYDSYGSLKTKTLYEYDDKGNRIELNEYTSNGLLERKVKYKYDDKGNNTEVIVYDSDGNFKLRLTNKYNEQLKTEYCEYDSLGKLCFKTTMKYDDKGNMIEHGQYRSDIDSYSKSFTEYEFDKNGNKVVEKNIDSDGENISRQTFEYDKKGNLIERKIYHRNERLYVKIRMDYDDNGNEIESRMYDSDEILYSKSTSVYDNKGNIISSKTWDRNFKDIWEWAKTIDYDEKGNWIREISFINQIPDFITEREIKYFDE